MCSKDTYKDTSKDTSKNHESCEKENTSESFCDSSLSKPLQNHENGLKIKKIEVSFGDAVTSHIVHDWYCHVDNNAKSIYLKGKMAPNLIISEGEVIYFIVDGWEHNEFVLTLSPTGKSLGKEPCPLEDFVKVRDGLYKYTVTQNTPIRFFYWCSNNNTLGGLVLKHRK